MDMNVALTELEQLANKVGVAVVYDHFTGEGMGPGGLCKVKGSWRVIIERQASPTEKVSILARALTRFDLEQHHISPDLRTLVDRSRGDVVRAEPELDPAVEPKQPAPVATEAVAPGETVSS